jgi:hypothetical protein
LKQSWNLHRAALSQASRIALHAGVRINFPPHIGTYLILAWSFLLAQRASRDFQAPCRLEIQGLDIAPIETTGTILSGLRKPLYVSASTSDRRSFLQNWYEPFLNQLSVLTGIQFGTSLYSESQQNPLFRKHFLHSLAFRSDLKWSISAFHSFLHQPDVLGIRFPCPRCGTSTFYGEQTKLGSFSPDGAEFVCSCRTHGSYPVYVSQQNDVVLDLQKVFRNIVKESAMADEPELLHLVIKGSDWIGECKFVDQGLNVLGKNPQPRMFLPVITTQSGVKLSKSGIHSRSACFADLPEPVTHAHLHWQDPSSAEKLLGAAASILGSQPDSRQSVSVDQLQSLLA